MFEILYSLSWLYGLTFCTTFHLLFEKSELDSNKSNILTCIVFQIMFLFTSYKLVYIYDDDYITILTLQNISFLYGYFIYDLIYMLFQDEYSKIEYIIHHIIGLLILEILISSTGQVDTLLYNIVSCVVETPNPFINLRILLKHNTKLKYYNKTIITFLYFVCRIILYPLMLGIFLIKINLFYSINFYINIVFMFLNSLIYYFSWSWFLKMNKSRL